MSEIQEVALVPTPMHLIELAVQKGADADQLGKLLELQLRWEADQQRKVYIAAMAEFRQNPPDINKTKNVRYKNKDNSFTDYNHAELDVITDVISEALAKVKIRPSWRTSDVGGKITVTCVLEHEQGHREDVATLGGPPDTSGGKNSIQAIGSTTTYLQRYTLLAGTGLVPAGIDNDGATDGLTAEGVQDYLVTLQDSQDMEELQKQFAAAYTAAKKINDKDSMSRFIEAKNARKQELMG